MTEHYACNDADFIATVGGFRALPKLLRLLSRGQPVCRDELVSSAGKAGAEFWDVLRRQPGTEWDSTGRLVGFGLTPRPTDHRFIVGGKTLYTWCASDALFFTLILGDDTVAESTCPVTGVPVRLEITPGGVTSVTPPEAVVSQRHRDDMVRDLRGDVCDQGHLFASASAAAGWAEQHPEGQVLSIADAFAECHAACEELGWLAAEGSGR